MVSPTIGCQSDPVCHHVQGISCQNLLHRKFSLRRTYKDLQTVLQQMQEYSILSSGNNGLTLVPIRQLTQTEQRQKSIRLPHLPLFYLDLPLESIYAFQKHDPPSKQKHRLPHKLKLPRINNAIHFSSSATAAKHGTIM